MEAIGKMALKEVKSVFTPMEEPIGFAVGNTIELVEAINFLKGNFIPEDLKKTVLEIGSYMIKLSGKGENLEQNRKKMLEAIKNGTAFNKLKEMVKNQGGDISYLDNVNKFKKAKYKKQVKSEKTGTIKEINAEEIGKLACFLGAGRIKKEDEIDHSVGIILNKKIGDNLNKGEILATIYANDEKKANIAENRLKDIYKFM